MLDYQKIKKDFPILSQTMNGHPLVFLDSAASSQRPFAVIEALQNYYEKQHANIHRGAYWLSSEATDAYEKTRELLAKFLHVPDTHCIIYTRNTTESLNLLAYTVGMDVLQKGDEILTSEIEHHSNLLPWQMLAQRKGASLRFLHLAASGKYSLWNQPSSLDSSVSDFQDIDTLLEKHPIKLMAIQHVSNAQGIRQPVEDLLRAAKKRGVVTVIDGAQGVPHELPALSDWDADFYCFSAHKMLGPTGLGFLIGRKTLLEQTSPFLTGGGMILSARKDTFESAELPAKFEAGTPAIAAVVALQQAIQYLSQFSFPDIQRHEQELVKMARARLAKVPKLSLTVSDQDAQGAIGGIVAFSIDGVHPHDIASVLDSEGVAVRAGHHCCEPWMRRNGISGTVRASFYIYNGAEDVERLGKAIDRVQQIFHH